MLSPCIVTSDISPLSSLWPDSQRISDHLDLSGVDGPARVEASRLCPLRNEGPQQRSCSAFDLFFSNRVRFCSDGFEICPIRFERGTEIKPTATQLLQPVSRIVLRLNSASFSDAMGKFAQNLRLNLRA